MKITIRHPAGLEIAFEGEPPEFDRFTSFLTELPAFVGTLGPIAAAQPLDLGDGGPVPAGVIDARIVGEQIAAIGAGTDIEKVTVMAHFAHESGADGIDYATVNRLYTELGMRKPTKLRATFSNAKQKGYVRSVGNGAWAPTVAGENFARHGLRAGTRRTRRANQPALSSGGGDDG